MADERKPLWPWIVALLIGLPVMYVASFGPACWLAEREVMEYHEVWRVYRPIVTAMWDGPDWMFKAIDAYAQLWAGETATFVLRSIELANRLEIKVR